MSSPEFEPERQRIPDDSLQSRMIRAARLDASLYDEVAADPRALLQALGVVLLSAAATGIAFGQGDLALIGWGMVFAVFGWWATSYLAYFLGTRLLAERTGDDAPAAPPPRPDALLRALGFASAPGVARLLGAVPELAVGVLMFTTGWMICASVLAIRQALRFHSTARAVGVYAAIQLLLVPLLLLLVSLQGQPPETAN